MIQIAILYLGSSSFLFPQALTIVMPCASDTVCPIFLYWKMQCCAVKHQKSKSRSKSSSDGCDSHDRQVPLDLPARQPTGSPWKNPRFGISDLVMKWLMIIGNSPAVHLSFTRMLFYPIRKDVKVIVKFWRLMIKIWQSLTFLIVTWLAQHWKNGIVVIWFRYIYKSHLPKWSYYNQQQLTRTLSSSKNTMQQVPT